MFYVLMPTADARARLIASLKSRGILAVFHYLPLHLSKMGQGFGGRPGDCPVSESVSQRLVRLPFYTSLSEEDQGRVIDAVRNASLSA
jgi:dTDP-4-amino-4,6-dideoxygalactose transaminase